MSAPRYRALTTSLWLFGFALYGCYAWLGIQNQLDVTLIEVLATLTEGAALVGVGAAEWGAGCSRW